MRKETIRIYWKYIWIFPPILDIFSYNLERLDFWWFSIICLYIAHWATSHRPLLFMTLMSHRLTVVQYSVDHVHGKRTRYRHRCQFWPVKIVWRWIRRRSRGKTVLWHTAQAGASSLGNTQQSDVSVLTLVPVRMCCVCFMLICEF